MRLVVVSDTHDRHEELGVLAGDVLIHCGDSGNGFSTNPAEVERLDAWFARQRFDLILCIGGNHDFELERRARAGGQVLRNAVYLEDATYEHDGIVYYGAPWTPDLPGWAFYLPPAEFAAKWARIPPSTDVLITHIGPRGILDRNRLGRSFGCAALLARLGEVRPRLHAFGHNHASAGTLYAEPTLHVNAAMVDSRYQIARAPFVFEIEPGSAAVRAVETAAS